MTNLTRRNSHSSTLFHYTKEESVLMSILREGLRYGYCLEEYFGELNACIPMISFCDIPIELSSEHSEKYGDYAIGLKKRYLMENYQSEIGPVNYCLTIDTVNAALETYKRARAYDKYIENLLNDNLSVVINDADGKCHRERDLDANEGGKALMSFFQGSALSEAASRSLGLMKMYESLNKGKMQTNYDECEWRMVYPEYAIIEDGELCKWFWSKSKQACDNWKKENKYRITDNLHFTLNDIDYILTSNEDQKFSVYNAVSNLDVLCGIKISDEERGLLHSKIVCVERANK